MILEKTDRVNMLCDAYAVLLNARQQDLLNLYFGEDYSLAEIAEQQQVSRQAVHDALHRAVQTLEAFEEKLHLVAKEQLLKVFYAEVEHLLQTGHHKEADRLNLQAQLQKLRTL